MRVNVTTLSELTGFDRRTISQRLLGVDADLDGQSKFYESTFVLPMLYGLTDPGSERLDPQQEKAELDKERRLLAKLNREAREGELLEREDVKQTWLNMIHVAKSRLSASRVSLSWEVAGLTDRVEIDRAISKAHNECLQALSSDDREREESAA